MVAEAVAKANAEATMLAKTNSVIVAGAAVASISIVGITSFIKLKRENKALEQAIDDTVSDIEARYKELLEHVDENGEYIFDIHETVCPSTNTTTPSQTAETSQP